MSEDEIFPKIIPCIPWHHYNWSGTFTRNSRPMDPPSMSSKAHQTSNVAHVRRVRCAGDFLRATEIVDGHFLRADPRDTQNRYDLMVNKSGYFKFYHGMFFGDMIHVNMMGIYSYDIACMLTHKNHQHGPSGARAKYWFLMKSMDCCNNPCGQPLEVEEAECQSKTCHDWQHHDMGDSLNGDFKASKNHERQFLSSHFYDRTHGTLEGNSKSTKHFQHYRHFQWPKDPNSWWITGSPELFSVTQPEYAPFHGTTSPSLQGTQLGIQKLREILVGSW